MYGIAAIVGFAQPLEVLQAVHGRIESQLAALEKLARDIAARGVDPTAREAARFALRFFEGRGAEHEREEEEMLFPLLRRKAGELGRAEISARQRSVQSRGLVRRPCPRSA